MSMRGEVLESRREASRRGVRTGGEVLELAAAIEAQSLNAKRRGVRMGKEPPDRTESTDAPTYPWCASRASTQPQWSEEYDFWQSPTWSFK